MARSGVRWASQWTRYQVAFGFLCFFLSIGMYTAQAFDVLIWGVDIDFSFLPLSLLLISGWVIIGVSVLALLQGRVPSAAREDAEDG